MLACLYSSYIRSSSYIRDTSTVETMGVGAQNIMGGTKFFPKKVIAATEFCQHTFYGKGTKIAHVGPQMLTAR